MTVRTALVTIGFPGSKPERTPQAARGRSPHARALRGARLATAIAYPYVAEPTTKPASPSSWPFALTTPPVLRKPEKLVQVRAPEPERKPTDRPSTQPLGNDAALHAPTNPPIKAPPIRVPPPAGHTQPPPAPQFSAADASDPAVASTVDTSHSELVTEVAPSLPVQSPTLAADGGGQPELGVEERTSRARIVERLWEDPIREELEVHLGVTTESTLYVDMDLQIANGGVFVATYQDLPPGTQVLLHITLPGGLATSAHGRVTLKRESLETFGDPTPGMCVAFELLSSEALAVLKQFASIRTPWLIEDE
jgi:hypothetical protein